MASKKKRQIQNSNKVAKFSCSIWSDLPPHLLTLNKHPLLMQSVSFGGISKSLRARPKSCLYNKNSTKILPYWAELSDLHCWDSSRLFRVKRDMPLMLCVDCDGLYFICNPFKQRYTCLQQWDLNLPSTCFRLASLFGSKSPEAILFTGMSQPAFQFSVLGFENTPTWIKQDCNIIDPNAPATPSHEKSAYLQFTSAVEFKGKVYALSLHGTITVIEFADSCLLVTSLGKFRAFPSLPFRHFKEYLLQSEEEILLVFVISKRSMNVVDDVEIFRLNCDTLLWEKVHSLGDKTVLVGANYGLLVSSVEARCRKNCVYFHHSRNDDTWWIFNMESHRVSLLSSCHENIEDE